MAADRAFVVVSGIGYCRSVRIATPPNRTRQLLSVSSSEVVCTSAPQTTCALVMETS